MRILNQIKYDWHDGLDAGDQAHLCKFRDAHQPLTLKHCLLYIPMDFIVDALNVYSVIIHLLSLQSLAVSASQHKSLGSKLGYMWLTQTSSFRRNNSNPIFHQNCLSTRPYLLYQLCLLACL